VNKKIGQEEGSKKRQRLWDVSENTRVRDITPPLGTEGVWKKRKGMGADVC